MTVKKIAQGMNNCDEYVEKSFIKFCPPPLVYTVVLTILSHEYATSYEYPHVSELTFFAAIKFRV
jgi:hypothetical protein